MKILSALFAVLFLFITTSVAQLRYALENPFESPSFFISFIMALGIFMLGTSISRKSIIAKFNDLQSYLKIKWHIGKVYKIN